MLISLTSEINALKLCFNKLKQTSLNLLKAQKSLIY